MPIMTHPTQTDTTMRMSIRFLILSWAYAMLLVTATADNREGEPGTATPYDAINMAIAKVDAEKIDGSDCVALFLISEIKGVTFDPEKAKFRVRTADGDQHHLRCEDLSGIPDGEISELVKEMRKEGYTHRLWIPKDNEKYLGGTVLCSLPKGSAKASIGRGALVLEAAEAGVASSQFELGQMYELGKGAAPNIKEAMKWYEMAANQGHPGAQLSLGVMCSTAGRNEEAYIWLKLARDKDPEKAKVFKYIASNFDAGERLKLDAVYDKRRAEIQRRQNAEIK